MNWRLAVYVGQFQQPGLQDHHYYSPLLSDYFYVFIKCFCFKIADTYSKNINKIFDKWNSVRFFCRHCPLFPSFSLVLRIWNKKRKGSNGVIKMHGVPFHQNIIFHHNFEKPVYGNFFLLFLISPFFRREAKWGKNNQFVVH